MPPFFSLPVGLTIATVCMATGVGGGVLWVPFLILAADLEPTEAVATALLIQILGQASGVAANSKAGNIDWKGFRVLAPLCAPGLLVGLGLSQLVKPSTLMILLGWALLLISLLFVAMEKELRIENKQDVDRRRFRRIWFIPATAPVLTGLFSLGVGDWLVPFLEGRLELRMRRAIGTSIVLMLFLSVFGFLGHLLLGNQPRMEIVAWAAPGVLAGGQIGVALARKFDDRFLKELFVFLLLLLGIHIIFQSY